MADWSKPALTDTYALFLQYINDRLVDLAKWNEAASVTMTNPPTNTVRYNASGTKWEKYNGTSWADLAASYAINISGNAATASAVPWSGITSKPTTISGYGLTDAAPLASPSLTGTPTAPTAGIGNSSTQLATTEFATKYCRGTKIHELTATASGGVMSVTTSPTQMDFRSTDYASGAVSSTYLPSLTINIPAAASLGTVSGAGGRIAVVVFFLNSADSAALGTSYVLGVCNANSLARLDEFATLPTLLSSSSTAKIIYSAQQINNISSYRVLGFFGAIWTSGTGWSSPTEVIGLGSAAKVWAQLYGVYQSVDTTTTYTSGQTYTNNRAKPITIYVIWNSGTGIQYARAYLDGVNVVTACASHNVVDGNLTLVVPSNSSFQFQYSNGTFNAVTVA